MKKYIRLSLLLLTIFVMSCEKEAENWSTNAVDYAGKFITERYDADGKVLDYFNTNKTKLYISNTAADVNTEILIKADYFGLTNKFDITGAPSDFKSSDLSFAKAYNNINALEAPGVPPTADGQKININRPQVKCALASAKIGKGAYTTPAGNVTDKLDITLVTYGGTITFTSKVKPEDQWVKPGVPDYKWELSNIVEYADSNANYTIKGFRHTGFHEDDLK